MKRSKSLSLILMGTLALSTSGCGSDDETYKAYGSISECVDSGLFNEAECRDFAMSAVAQAPSFGDKEECERKFGVGSCEEKPMTPQEQASETSTTVQPRSGSSWMPMMMGFMAGRYMGGGGMMQGAQPLFRNDDKQQGGTGASSGGSRSFRTATGDTISTDAKGSVKAPSAQLKQSLGYSAKPVIVRSGAASSSGFSGGSLGGGS